ncbi:MAG: hypothetical protein V3T98_01620 [Candidatus Paceibacterota bacterium]
MRKILVFSFCFLVIGLLLTGCATLENMEVYYPPDCPTLSTAGEQALCEKGKSDEATRVQKIRERAAYDYGKTGYYGGYNNNGYNTIYWPILSVRVKTWSGLKTYSGPQRRHYGYHRLPYRHDYNCDGFLRYTPHCN